MCGYNNEFKKSFPKYSSLERTKIFYDIIESGVNLLPLETNHVKMKVNVKKIPLYM